MCACMLSRFSHVQFSATLWTIACQAPLFMGFSRQEYWSGMLCPSPGDLPDPGIKPASLTSPALASWVLCYECHLRSPSFLIPKRKHHFTGLAWSVVSCRHICSCLQNSTPACNLFRAIILIILSIYQ